MALTDYAALRPSPEAQAKLLKLQFQPAHNNTRSADKDELRFDILDCPPSPPSAPKVA